MTRSSEIRWYVQWVMAVFAIPVGAVLLQFLLGELPKYLPFLNWIYNFQSMTMFGYLVFGTWPYYLLSWWIHYRVDKKEGFNFSWRESWRLKIGVYGVIGLILLQYFMHYLENQRIYTLNFMSYFVLPILLVSSIFFTGWISEMIVRWKQRNKSE